MTKDQIIDKLLTAISKKQLITPYEWAKFDSEYNDFLVFIEPIEGHLKRSENIIKALPDLVVASEILILFIGLEYRLLKSYIDFRDSYLKINNIKITNKKDRIQIKDHEFISYFRFIKEILNKIDIIPSDFKHESRDYEDEIIKLYGCSGEQEAKRSKVEIKQYLETTIKLLQEHNNLFVALLDNKFKKFLTSPFIVAIKRTTHTYQTNINKICKLIDRLEHDSIQINKDEKRVIIFIHGLGGDKDKTWKYFKKIIDKDSTISEKFKTCYPSYKSSAISSSLERAAFLGNQILTKKNLKVQELTEWVQYQFSKYVKDEYSIHFVCHSLGGLICQQFIIDLCERSASIKQFKSLIFFAVPLKGSDKAKLSKCLRGYDDLHYQLGKNSDYLKGLDEKWQHHKVSENIDMHLFFGSNDIIAKYVGDSELQNYYKAHMKRPSALMQGYNHWNIIKPKKKDHPSYEAFKEILTKNIK